MSENLSELFVAVADWAASFGETNLRERPGLWSRSTERAHNLGPFDVRLNPHDEETEGIPPFSFTIGMDRYFPGIVAVVGPRGGTILYSPRKGEDEDGLIEHFRKQPRLAGAIKKPVEKVADSHGGTHGREE